MRLLPFFFRQRLFHDTNGVFHLSLGMVEHAPMTDR